MNAEAAAALLGTTTAILSVWEQRFGFPVPVRSDDGQRLYPEEVMIALRNALGRQLSVASAITEARGVQPADKPQEAP
jgi:DNA-binding transcriptional MerR regulator